MDWDSPVPHIFEFNDIEITDFYKEEVQIYIRPKESEDDETSFRYTPDLIDQDLVDELIKKSKEMLPGVDFD